MNALAQFPCFNGMPPGLAEKLTEVAKVAKFKAGDVIAREGENLNYLLGVISGKLQASNKGVELEMMDMPADNQGYMIGWLSVIDGKPIHVTLTALTDIHLLLVPVEFAKELLFSFRPLAELVFKKLSDVIRRQESAHQILTQPKAFQRIYLHLANLAENSHQKSNGRLFPRQNEIAVQVNASRETVSRAVQALIKEGIALKQGHTIKIVRLDLLKHLATGALDSPRIVKN